MASLSPLSNSFNESYKAQPFGEVGVNNVASPLQPTSFHGGCSWVFHFMTSKELEAKWKECSLLRQRMLNSMPAGTEANRLQQDVQMLFDVIDVVVEKLAELEKP